MWSVEVSRTERSRDDSLGKSGCCAQRPLDDRRSHSNRLGRSAHITNTAHRVRQHTRRNLNHMGAAAASSPHILPMASGEDAGTLSALLACSSFTLSLLRQRASSANYLVNRGSTCTCTAVVSALCRTVSLPSDSDSTFMQPVHLSPSGPADEGRRLAFRPPVTFKRFHVRFSRSWLLRLVPVEEASTWMSNLNSADTTSAFGTVRNF